ncbi:hypothetical protein DFH09DRAFT_1166054 [Mycena vulgaris]|nr:hypothetical protein DFH09DRAFT_1166054 [Mycena vulgaris]
MSSGSCEHCFPRSPLLRDPPQREKIGEFLRSHLEPPDDVLPKISALSAELTRYDEEIGRLKEQLLQLERDHAVLQADHDDCQSLFAPIRRLPAETLADIFAACLSESTPAVDVFDTYDNYEAPYFEGCMARLAQAPLLDLSQVCVRWHGIAMSTPALWSTIQLNAIIWNEPGHHETVLRLLQVTLERGADSPLTLILENLHFIAPCVPVFELLAQHSGRWWNTTFVCPSRDLSHFSAVNGRLPRLQTLQIQTWSVEGPLIDMHMFEVAPLLTTIRFSSDDPTDLVRLPLEQLRELHWQYIPLDGQEYTVDTRCMARLAPDTRFTLWDQDVSALEEFLGGLTLPCLEELEMMTEQYPHKPIPWPRTAFPALGARSSFSTQLRSLQLYHVLITEADLLDCLASLLSLERLAISDKPLASADESLITNTLLAALTHSPLVPRLRSLRCRSRLQFDDHVYLEFVLSRLQAGRPFESEIEWLFGYFRELDPAVVARLYAMTDLRFSFHGTVRLNENPAQVESAYPSFSPSSPSPWVNNVGPYQMLIQIDTHSPDSPPPPPPFQLSSDAVPGPLLTAGTLFSSLDPQTQIHPWLNGHAPSTVFNFDFESKAFTPSHLVGTQSVATVLSQTDYLAPAFYPGRTSLRILHPTIPFWPIDITPPVGLSLLPPISFGDVLDQHAVAEAVTRRCRAEAVRSGVPEADLLDSEVTERNLGIKRLDFLQGKTVFKGLVYVPGDPDGCVRMVTV